MLGLQCPDVTCVLCYYNGLRPNVNERFNMMLQCPHMRMHVCQYTLSLPQLSKTTTLVRESAAGDHYFLLKVMHCLESVMRLLKNRRLAYVESWLEKSAARQGQSRSITPKRLVFVGYGFSLPLSLSLSHSLSLTHTHFLSLSLPVCLSVCWSVCRSVSHSLSRPCSANTLLSFTLLSRG
jgi:hypothetical protein